MPNTSNLLVSTLTTDLSIAPYYDDYDSVNNYYRILYKPGYAVQGRELTQAQTMLQKQISRFGKHVFQEGSIVIPGGFNLMTANTEAGPVYYVKVKDTDNSNNEVNIDEFLDVTIIGQTNNISAEISFVLDGTEANTDTKTIFVDYKGVAAANAQISTFQAGEILVANGVGNLVVLSTNPTGRGSAFSIFEGVFFAKDHFIQFESQSTILRRYSDVPTCKVGFYVYETLVDSTDDSGLLDPALESSNYSAPGADRLKLSPILTLVDIDDPIGPPDFVTLFTVLDGVIQTTFERPQYNILQDEIAKRTFDESGDYYVNGISVSLREHQANGVNGGYKTAANGGNTQLLSVQISDGVAYCKGYEVGIPPGVTTYLTTEKSETFESVNSQLSSGTLGSFVTCNNVTGVWTMDQGQIVHLYDTPNERLVDLLWSTGAAVGSITGNARIASVEYNSGTLGTPAGEVDVYLMDIRMAGTNNFSEVRSIYYNHAAADIGGDIVLSGNNAVLQDTGIVPLFFVGSNFTKTINPSALSDTTFLWRTTTAVSIGTGGTFSLPLPAGADQFPYGTTTLSDSQKRELLLVLNETVNLSQAGTLTNNSTTIIGTATDFTKLNVGDKIEIAGVGSTYYIASITNTTNMVITTNLAGTSSGNAFSKVYKVGDIIDLTTIGANNSTERSVAATPTALDFTLNEGYAATKSASVSYPVATTEALAIGKNLRVERFAQINCASHPNGTTGPYWLGFPDVFEIKEIRTKTGVFTSNTQGTEATTSFIFDDGQRDLFYDSATITPKITIANTDFILVRLDYFEPDFTVGYGFFSVDSYDEIGIEEIPFFKSPTSGQEYDLRNYLDFRPVKALTAADSTTVAGATVNPTISGNFDFDANGLRFVAPSSQLTYDYEFYLARKDVVTLSKEGIFSIIKGNPDNLAITPSTPDSLMAIATLSIAPWPSLSLYYANQIRRRDLACVPKRTSSVRFTMRDIGVLKDRIINLEYYQAISLLEKAAIDLRILDENGLDRFKNGFFVDTFADHSLGATYNNDYMIAVDPKEKSIRPLFTMDSIYYNYISGSGVVRKNDLVLLTYTEVPFITLDRVTTTRNTERTTWRFIGSMELDPELDIWVDTSFAPDKMLTFGPTGEEITEMQGGLSTEWDSWRTYITGYNVYSGSRATPREHNVFVGNFATEAEARTAANRARTTRFGATIETLFASDRSGIEDFLLVDEDTKTIGDKVIDVSIQPYIRPQTIKILARGLKPYARYYTFFDGIDMSAFVTPITEAEYDTEFLTNTAATEGDTVRAPANGEVFVLLRLPTTGRRFIFGTKAVILTDSPTNEEEDSTTFALGYFVAQGLNQTKQDTIITTRTVINQERVVEQNRIDPSAFRRIGAIPPPSSGSCLAYSFPVKVPEGEDGLFLTSVTVYCADKHPTLDLWVEVLELDTAGGITQNRVPFSSLWINNADITVSADGITNPLNIEFSSPLFLQGGKSYAFVLHPESLNPNYYFWVSRIGQTDINTGQPVTSRALSGTLSTTNNGVVWDVVPDVDLTCEFNRALFTSASGTATLGNQSKEKFILASPTASLSRYGERFSTGNKLTISGISGGTIAVTDYILGANSGANGTVLVAADPLYKTSNTNFITAETINVLRANGYNATITGTISGITTGTAVLQKYKESANLITGVFISSNGNFQAGDIITDFTTGSSATISKIEHFRYSVIDPEPSYLIFHNTSLDFEIKPYANSTAVPGSFTAVTPNENYHFDAEEAVYSKSYEVASLASARTNQMRATFRSSSTWVSPVLDVGKTQSIVVDNIINNDATGEDGPSGGYLWNKYISKTITLAEGQDAEDMTLILTAYRPPNTNVRVWVKILHSEDADLYAQKNWIELEKTLGGDALYSSLSNHNDFKEFKFGFPEAFLTGTNGTVKYTNSQSISFEGYKYFGIKIGLMGTNSGIVPRVADLRAIAIQI